MPFNPAFDDDSDPDNWFVQSPTGAPSAGFPSTIQPTPFSAPLTNPLATPAPGTWPGSPDAWRRFWPMFPARFALASAWRPPTFLNSDPTSGIGLASSWPVTSTVRNALPSTAATADPPPSWPPSQSLLGLIPYLSTTPADSGTKGFFSIPVLNTEPSPDAPAQNLTVPDPSTSQTTYGATGSPAAEPNGDAGDDEVASPEPSIAGPQPQTPRMGMLSKFLDRLNPISSAQAAEGEGPPMSPEVARALAEALHNSAAAAELFKTRDALARYHEALQDLYAYARNVSSSRTLGKLLELSGRPRPEGHEAHHIVAGNNEVADPGRKILEKFGININDPANGVWLPANKDTPNPEGRSVHRPLHTDDYMEAVNKALEKAKTRQKAIDILKSIGRALESGGYR